MNDRQLQIFKAVCQCRNFTKAADLLHIAQPAVSISIRKLEEEIGLTLFNRQEKTVSLTPEGKRLLNHANLILDNFKAAEAEMAELKGLGSGKVKIGIPPMMSAHFFPKIIMGFKDRYPGIDVAVNGDGAASIHRMIAHGQIDIGVIAGYKIAQGICHKRFLREEIVAVVDTNHPFACKKSITIDEYFQQPLIMYPPGYYMRELMDDLTKQNGYAPEVVFQTNLFSLVRSLIKKGMGISTFLKMVAAADEDLAAVSFSPPFFLDLDIAWKENRHLSRANQAFIDYLLAYIATTLI